MTTDKKKLSDHLSLNPIQANLQTLHRSGKLNAILDHLEVSDTDLFTTIEIKNGIFQSRNDYIHINNTISDLTFKECEFEDMVAIKNDIEGITQLHFYKCTFRDKVFIHDYLGSSIHFDECVFEENVTLSGKASSLGFSNISCEEMNLDLNIEKSDSISIIDSKIRSLTVFGDHSGQVETEVHISRSSINFINLRPDKKTNVFLSGTSSLNLKVSSPNLNLSAHNDLFKDKSPCTFSGINLTSFKRCNIQNAVVYYELQVSDLATYDQLVLDSVSFSEKTKINLSNCDFKNAIFRNINFENNSPQILTTSFQNSIFFNCRWNKKEPLTSPNHTDIIEAFRTLKISYRKDENTYWNQFFFAQEQNAIRKYAEELKLSFGDRIILNFNHLTGYGNSFFRAIGILLCEVILFLGLISLVNGYKIDLSNFRTSVPFFFHVIGKILNVTTPFADETFVNVNEFVVLIHKIFLGAIYYQIILSFRKFGRK